MLRFSFLFVAIGLVWLSCGSFCAVLTYAQPPPPDAQPSPAGAQSPPVSEAIGILRGVENTRSVFKPFRVRGTVTRPHSGDPWNSSFVVECEAERYRISVEGPAGPVAIFDGDQLFCYDGDVSATIITPDRRAATCLAFDPRSLGFSTGLYSDLTLEKDIAYHSATNFSLTQPEASEYEADDVVSVELTDRFDQRIRFDVEPRSPFRVFFYSKSIFTDDGNGIFTQYITETEYWPNDVATWIPRKIIMYTLQEGKQENRVDNVIVEFEKPEFVDEFDSGIWTIAGLSLPFGQPLTDLRIMERIGYWNGNELVELPPSFEPQPIAEQQPEGRSTRWLILINVAALGLIMLLLYWRRRRS